MIKRTLFFGNPVYLNTRNEQLIISYPNEESPSKSVAIEDIGLVILENQQITITNGLLKKFTENNIALVNCDDQHMPIGLLMPLEKHSEQTERFAYQLKASLPLKKNLWQQTIQAKILNQANFLASKNKSIDNMLHWAKNVTSGDTQNHEGRAAAYYWNHIFDTEKFNRKQDGIPPNNLLNYGYAILRAITARALIGSGLLPILGIQHKNKYNAYCLADDIMEPYRPYVDFTVNQIINRYTDIESLTTQIKTELLQIPALDVVIDNNTSPLLLAMSRTTNSLTECFKGNSRKILYPVFNGQIR